MGKIKKILESELIGGTQAADVYPVTSTKAVYDENNERLDNIIRRRDDEILKRRKIIFPQHYKETISGLEEALSVVPQEDRIGTCLLFFKDNSVSKGKLYYFISNNPIDDNWNNLSYWYEIYTGEQVNNLFSSISNNIDNIEETIGFLSSNFFPKTECVSNGSHIRLPSTIDFSTVGDYIEWQCANTSPYPYKSDNISMIYYNDTNPMAGGLYADNKFYFRTNSIAGADYRSWNLGLNFDASKIHTYKISNTASGWELFVDGVSYGVKAISEKAKIDILGGCYFKDISFTFVSFNAHSAISGDFSYNNADLISFLYNGKLILNNTDIENNIDNIENNIDNIENNIDNIENNIDNILGIYRNNYYSSYNETDDYSYTKIDKPLTLKDVGDYVEIVCKKTKSMSGYKNYLNLLNTGDGGMNMYNRFGFYTNDQFWMRIDNNTYLRWTGIPNSSTWRKIKLVVVETGWELFIDDVSYGVREKTVDFPIVMIGANSSIKPTSSSEMSPQFYNIKKCYVHTSLGDQDYSPLALQVGSKNVALHEEKINSQPNVNPLCFVSYNAVGKRFKIYMRDKQNQNLYYMVSVALQSTAGKPTDPIHYQHLWEIDEKSKRCTYNSEEKVMEEDVEIISGGESEYVFHYGVNKTDYTGGWHGDERIDIDENSFVNFYIDGVKLTDGDLSEDIMLKECNSFQYIQKSSIHETAVNTQNKETVVDATGNGVLSLDGTTHHFIIDGVDTGIIAYYSNYFMTESQLSSLTLTKSENNKWVISRVVEVVEGHPIIATHIKKTVFANQSYKTENTLIFNKEVYVGLIYAGICCLSKNCAKFGHNEDYEDVEFTGTSGTYLGKKGYKMFESYNPETKISATINSKMIRGAITDNECNMFIWDRTDDSKYYWQTPEFTSQIGESIVSEMVVQFGITE